MWLRPAQIEGHRKIGVLLRYRSWHRSGSVAKGEESRHSARLGFVGELHPLVAALVVMVVFFLVGLPIYYITVPRLLLARDSEMLSVILFDRLAGGENGKAASLAALGMIVAAAIVVASQRLAGRRI